MNDEPVSETANGPGTRTGYVREVTPDIPDCDETNADLDAVSITVGDTTIPVSAVNKDGEQAHRDLNQKKRASLAYCAALDQRILQAENEGDMELAEELTRTRNLMFDVYNRIKYLGQVSL